MKKDISVHTVERIEWMPVTVSYEVSAEAGKDALKKMNDYDEGILSDVDTEAIYNSRTTIKRNDDPESARDLDEEGFWKVDGVEVNEMELSDSSRITEENNDV